jgi:hypothetical protein
MMNVFLGCAVSVLALTASWWTGDSGRKAHHQAYAQFDNKFIVDMESFGWIYTVGTMIGPVLPGLFRQYNTTRIKCFKAEMYCETNTMNVIGGGDGYVLMGRLDSPLHIDVTNGTTTKSSREPRPFQPSVFKLRCLQTTITINRKTQTVSYTEIPAECRDGRPTCTWYLGNPPRPMQS